MKNKEPKTVFYCDEINDDFERFIRHEAMRANITQEELKEILGLI